MAGVRPNLDLRKEGVEAPFMIDASSQEFYGGEAYNKYRVTQVSLD